ncbi:MAG: hypothetical protein OEX77_08600 [Candidatus Bathyarchaeota archaeon]|nr:hypothetical protein [Candidatus Bathyarchaeota archaeon]MDH5732617.1 hypothetical protein [Candidatus Bathyarchaeota archaeon]
MPHHSRRKKKRNTYSKGELNRLIDSLLHPLIDRNPAFMITDVILHGLVEQNPSETTIKFIRYSLPKIIKEIMGNVPTYLKANTCKRS